MPNFIDQLKINMNHHKKICVIGAANVDIIGFAKEKLIYKDSNIGTMKINAGGVGRNIAENLSRLDFDINFISVFGDDALSNFIKDSCKTLRLKIEDSLFLTKMATPTFMAIMDRNDLAVAISATSIFDLMSIAFIKSKINTLNNLDYIVLETNMSQEILEYIVKQKPDYKYVLDTVSGKKALRAKPILPYLHILKTNLLEANTLSGLNITDEVDYPKLVHYFLNKGVKKVFITLGEKGVIYGDINGIEKQQTNSTKIKNTIGAGDAFVAGIIYADSQSLTMHEIATYGLASARINLQQDTAVSTALNNNHLKNTYRSLTS